MSTRRTLHLNTNISGLGRHPAAWRKADNPRAITDLAHFTEIAQTAERGRLDAVFLSDMVALRGHAAGTWQSLEPTVLLTALAGVTQSVGLIGTASTTFNDPYNLARRFASLDHVSAGRIAWNAVTTYDADAAANFSMPAPLDKETRYARAAEFIEVVEKLWDSWEDGALVADRTSGLYADPARVHEIAYEGQFFRVRGPLNVPRSPQGRPVLVQAGGSPTGVALAARHADAVFTSQTTLKSAQAFYREIKAVAAGHGRNPDHLLILPGLYPVIGGTLAEAHQRKAELDALLDRSVELAKFAGTLGLKPTDLELDAPLPYALIDTGTRTDVSHGFIRSTVLLAQGENLTVRDLLDRNPGAHRMIVGTPQTIADDIESWFLQHAADGFNLNADTFPSGLADFVDHVVPILQRKGIFRRDYDGTTLREHYGLPRPPSRYEAEAASLTTSA
ncbi:LLM class flavin-dependent oxidoreductase [Chitinasiproducens palmae]|uniref:FMN-dependent oxidoreductase, nitrilotriacetate monooxygenase family n=1 Tax=Chitinasiproducens palmae TaxID=1770053 RepID=A0A1H2PL43_9BURK|nr:LLM class flavin-dependent oxidoreductase [Chitinasiproducens palmae]SDV47199.1 FMN-dependent oxidoreductase, nitrilotriacetate monooxygenase family [Chitinasiproducens palmae]